MSADEELQQPPPKVPKLERSPGGPASPSHAAASLRLQATQHEACHVRVTVRDKSSGSGHKFKLAGVMVLPAGTNEFSSSDRLEVVVPQMFEGGKGEPTVARVKPAAGP